MKNITVLISGTGTNLQRIIDCISNGKIADANINLVVADRICEGLEKAEQANIATVLINRGKYFSSNLMEVIPSNTDLIVLAGFLSVLSSAFCEKWKGKIINIHPSLLPKYGGKGMWGMNVHRAVIEAHEKESGATVHFVTSQVDEGKIILQKSVNIQNSDTPESLAEKVHQIEYEILPEAINKILNS